MVSAELMQEREHAQRVSTVLDRINGRYGNNALYFGAMQHALAANAAPMRIPFSTIPDTALEQDVAAKSPPHKPPRRESDNELWLQRERQFKVLAEHTHREAARSASRSSRPALAAGRRGGMLPSLTVRTYRNAACSEGMRRAALRTHPVVQGKKETPQPKLRGFAVKTLAMTYSRMLSAHYHRRVRVSLPSSGWDRVVPRSYCHQGEGGGSRADALA